MKTKLDLNTPLYAIADESDEAAIDCLTPVRDQKNRVFRLSQALSQMLSNAGQSTNPLKHWEWAKDLARTGVLELDESDYEELKKFVTSQVNASTAWRAQLESAINNAKHAQITQGKAA